MRDMKRIIRLVTAAVLMTSMILTQSLSIYASEKEEVSDRDVSYEEKELPVFRKELTDETVKIRYYSSSPSVPYIGIKEFYDHIMKDSHDPGDHTMTVEKDGDSTYILTNAYGQAKIDTEKDVMSSDNMTEFTNLMSLIQEGIDSCYCDGIPYVRISETKRTGDGSVKYDLGKYDIDIYGDDDDVYFPASTLSDIFTDLVYHYMVCNGETVYFNVDESVMYENIANRDPDYALPIINALGDDNKRPKDMAEYAYNKLLFTFDNFYGLPGKAALNDDLAEKGLEQALTEYGSEGEKTLELLKSEDFAEYMEGLKKLNLFVYDGGHTDVTSVHLANAGQEELDNKCDELEEELEDGFKNIQSDYDEIEEFWKYYSPRIKMRNDAYNGEKYIKQGDTAVYVLDSFMGFDMGKWNRYYKEGGSKPSILSMRGDDILYIDECMKDADEDPEIKNFVIDCSNNTGGSLDEVAMLTCLITGEREVSFCEENVNTGQRLVETYEADTNFDREFDEKDEREPYDLNFAILTSSTSFSCGNIFPSIMKDKGYLIMGERSGGGSCAVLVGTTGEGMTFRMSAYSGRMLNEAGENIDNGIEVDVDLLPKRSNGLTRFTTVELTNKDTGETVQRRTPDYSGFYDLEKLSAAINDYYSKK